MNRRESAIEAVKTELQWQDNKWGYPQKNHPFEWISILTEEVGELAQAVNEAHFQGGKTPGNLDHAIDEAVQVAAVAVSIVDHLRRRKENLRLEAAKNDLCG